MRVYRQLGQTSVASLALVLVVLGALLLAHPQTARYVDPSLDLIRLPSSGGALSPGGDDAQIVRFRNWAALAAVRHIRAGDYTLELPHGEPEVSGLRYRVGDRQYSLDDFMLHNHVGGLLVLKDGEIRVERYGLGNTEESLWVSFSMAKSITSLLLGAAIRDGYIASVEDKVTDYLPRLRGSSYDQVSVRDVLWMASGVRWNEDYADPRSDVATYPGTDMLAVYDFLGSKPRVAEPGTVFNYNTGETDLAGAIVRAAIGNNLATYLEHKIWRPFGMESDANWATHGLGGGERGGCCISATLRDYGRLGLFAMNGGVLADGTGVLPERWMRDSVTPSPGSARYGYLWWLEADGAYRASGIYGQGLYIDPVRRVVIVVLSAWPTATGAEYATHRDSMFAAVAHATW